MSQLVKDMMIVLYLRAHRTFDYHQNLYCRAYGGDKDGSFYLQAFATFLQDQDLKRSLDRIYLMVKKAMIEAQQV